MMIVIQHNTTQEKFMLNTATVTDDPTNPNNYVIPPEFSLAADQTPVPYLLPKSVKWEATNLNPLDR
jgi:hypothetical protein